MFKSSLVYLFSSIIAKLSPFILLPIITLRLSASDFSLGSVYISIISFLSVLISLGTQTTIPKFYYELDKSGFSKITSNVIVIITIFSALLIALTSVFFVYDSLNWYYFLIIFSAIGMVGTNLYLSLLRTISALKAYVSFEVIYTVISFLLVFFFVYPKEKASIDDWVIPICIVNISFGLIAYVKFNKIVNVKLIPERECIEKIFSICLPLIPHSISLIIINVSDRIILNRLVDSSDVASYILAANLVVVMKVVSDAFMKAWNPFYFKNVDRKTQIRKYKLYFVLLYVFLSLIFYVVCYFSFGFFFISEYNLALSIIPILILGYMVFIFYQLNVSILIHLSYTRVLQFITPFSAIVNVLGNFLFIPYYGVMSAAFMTLLSYSIMAISTHLFIRRKVL